MDDILGCRITGPGNILLTRLERGTNRVNTWDVVAMLAKNRVDRLTHARHQLHTHHHVGRVGELNTDMGNG